MVLNAEACVLSSGSVLIRHLKADRDNCFGIVQRLTHKPTTEEHIVSQCENTISIRLA
jgi:hypothetical protein